MTITIVGSLSLIFRHVLNKDNDYRVFLIKFYPTYGFSIFITLFASQWRYFQHLSHLNPKKASLKLALVSRKKEKEVFEF